MDATSSIHFRRCVRQFTDEPAAPERIELRRRFAMAALSAGSQQPWRLVVSVGRFNPGYVRANRWGA